MTSLPLSNVALLLPMDGNGSTFIDFSSSPKNIQSFNATQSSTQSKWGTKSGYFDGINSYLSLSSSSSFNFAGDFTIETWVYPTELTTYCTILEGRSAIAYENYICGLYNIGGQYRVDFVTSDSSSRLTGSSTIVPLNQWSHVAFVRSGNTLKAYVNGVMDATSTSYTGVMNVTSSTLFVGKNVDGHYAKFYLNDLRITNGQAIIEVPQGPLLTGGTTTTTTVAPSCPCGSLYLPKGKAFSASGLSIVISSVNLDAITVLELDSLHSEDIYLESGEKFVTVTPIITEHIIPTKISIVHSLPITVKNVIHVVIKDKLSKSIIGTQYIGKYNETTTIDNITVNLHSSIDLYDNAIIVEIHSLCDNGSDPCCDKLPSEIDIVGPRLLCVPLEQYYVLPTTTTTTTPEPFTIEFLTSPTNQIVNANTKATFSFSAISLYDNGFKYWWEKSEDNGSSWKKASRLLEGVSRKIHTLVVLAFLPMNGTQYRVVIVEPKIKYSNNATLFVIQPTTTTTTTTTFNPVTTTLPPCDLQIFGSASSSSTTTTTTTTTTTGSPATTSTSTTTTLSPSSVPAYYLVVNSAYGGKYCEDGSYDGKPTYNKVGTSLYMYYVGTGWRINDTGNLGNLGSNVYASIDGGNTPPTGANWFDNNTVNPLTLANNFYTTFGQSIPSYTFIHYGTNFNGKPLYTSLDGYWQMRYTSHWVIEDTSGDPENPTELWINDSNANTPPLNGWVTLTSSPTVTLIGPNC